MAMPYNSFNSLELDPTGDLYELRDLTDIERQEYTRQLAGAVVRSGFALTTLAPARGWGHLSSEVEAQFELGGVAQTTSGTGFVVVQEGLCVGEVRLRPRPLGVLAAQGARYVDEDEPLEVIPDAIADIALTTNDFDLVGNVTGALRTVAHARQLNLYCVATPEVAARFNPRYQTDISAWGGAVLAICRPLPPSDDEY